jgi:hypothetical protein
MAEHAQILFRESKFTEATVEHLAAPACAAGQRDAVLVPAPVDVVDGQELNPRLTTTRACAAVRSDRFPLQCNTAPPRTFQPGTWIVPVRSLLPSTQPIPVFLPVFRQSRLLTNMAVSAQAHAFRRVRPLAPEARPAPTNGLVSPVIAILTPLGSAIGQAALNAEPRRGKGLATCGANERRVRGIFGVHRGLTPSAPCSGLFAQRRSLSCPSSIPFLASQSRATAQGAILVMPRKPKPPRTTTTTTPAPVWVLGVFPLMLR